MNQQTYTSTPTIEEFENLAASFDAPVAADDPGRADDLAGGLQQQADLAKASPPLGNITRLPFTPPNEAEIDEHKPELLSRSRRYELQRVAAELLPNERVSVCMDCLATGREVVDVIRRDDAQDAYFRNLMVCNSIWICPICAAKISEERRIELQDAIDVWHMAGNSTLHLVHTLQHNRFEPCTQVLDGLIDGLTRFWAGRPVKRLVDQYGIAGRVAGLEVTYGGSGWHIHRHTILFIDGPLLDNKQVAVIEREMAVYWKSTLERRDRYASVEHGLRIIRDHDKLAGYLNKFGHLPSNEDVLKRWTGANEATKSNLKQTWGGTMTPIDLLIAYELTEEPETALLFQEFAHAFKGKKQLIWSRGLRDLIDQLRQEPEEEPEEEEGGRVICQIPREQWREIVKRGLRGKVLTVAARGGDEALKNYLEGAGLRDCHYPDLELSVLGLSDDTITVDINEFVWGD